MTMSSVVYANSTFIGSYAHCLQDSDNNYILMLLADKKASSSDNGDPMGAVLRMSRLYYDRYPDTLDWQNVHGKTALHFAAQRGNEELVRVCQLSFANVL